MTIVSERGQLERPANIPARWETFKTALKEESIFFAAPEIMATVDAYRQETDPEYDMNRDPRVADNEMLRYYMIGSDSYAETTHRLAQLERMQDRRRILEEDALGGAFSMVASMANPDVFIGGGAIRAAGAFRAAGLMTSAAVGQEAILQAASPDRDMLESMMTVALMGGTGKVIDWATDAGRAATPRVEPYLGTIRSEGMEASAKYENAASVGAAEAPGADAGFNFRASFEERMRRQAEQSREESMVETGIGLEKVPLNPIVRVLNNSSVRAKQLVQELVNQGGIITNKNTAAGGHAATPISVERLIQQRWTPQLAEAIHITDRLYLRMMGVEKGGAGRAGLESIRAGTQGKMTAQQFRREVTRALRNNDQHHIPEVRQAAAIWRRKIVNPMEDAANEAGLFTRSHKIEMERYRQMLKRKDVDAGMKKEYEARIKNIEARIREIETEGGGIKSYFPRIWKPDAIRNNRADFERRLSAHFQTRGLNKETADLEARATTENILTEFKGTAEEGERFAREHGAFRERHLDIEDEQFADFLENDAEVALREVYMNNARDIELTRAFGDIDMKMQLDEIEAEYNDLIRAAPDEAAIASLKKQMKADIRDITALRDRLRGAYVSPSLRNDQFRHHRKHFNWLRSFNVLTFMGGAAISSLPDVGRVIMTEGLTNTARHIFEPLMQGNLKAIRNMSRKELNRMGEALDMVLSTRAMAMADIGDTFGSGIAGGHDRVMNRMASGMFLFNGLNAWNTAMKEVAGIVISGRMLDDIMSYARASELSKTKLARSGIDEAMATRIAKEVKANGERRNKTWMPNTDEWDDRAAAEAFLAAVGSDVSRTIVTPGAGDTALWTSSELGSLIAQFKSFGQASVNRTLISGLQERDQAFMQGLFLLVGLGMATDQIKRAMFDQGQPESVSEAILDGVDRSGALGIYMDLNNALERLTNYNVGARAFMDVGPNYSSLSTKFSAMSPSFTHASNIWNAASDMLSGTYDEGTAYSLQSLTPGGNLPYVAPALKAGLEPD